MNRIEERLAALKEEGKKAFITYTTAGLPDYDTTKKIMSAQEKAGIDIMEIGVPFSDPIADGPVIQDASFKAIQNGASLEGTFTMMGEVRKAGLELGIPENLVFRQPFPGPGLGIRIIGEVTADKVRIVQDADFIYREEVDKAAEAYKNEHGKEAPWMPNQYFAALTNMRSVGVMGDERTYDYAVALRAVQTIDFMTAESAQIPFEVLQTVMTRIINEVKGVNRIFYDLTSKPPGTIEFE